MHTENTHTYTQNQYGTSSGPTSNTRDPTGLAYLESPDFVIKRKESWTMMPVLEKFSVSCVIGQQLLVDSFPS